MKTIETRPVKFEYSESSKVIITLEVTTRNIFGKIKKRTDQYIAIETLIPDKYWSWREHPSMNTISIHQSYLLDSLYKVEIARMNRENKPLI